MIQYNPKSWFSLIFAAYSRHVFRRLFPLLLAMGLLSSGSWWRSARVPRLRGCPLHYSITADMCSVVALLLAMGVLSAGVFTWNSITPSPQAYR